MTKEEFEQELVTTVGEYTGQGRPEQVAHAIKTLKRVAMALAYGARFKAAAEEAKEMK